MATIITVQDRRRRWVIARATGVVGIDETVDFIRTARADVELRSWPLLFDASGSTTTMRDDDVGRAVSLVEAAIRAGQRRGHVALVADDDELYGWLLKYEMACGQVGAPIVRVFRRRPDAEHWLGIVSASRQYALD